jgi:hypothetical protein
MPVGITKVSRRSVVENIEDELEYGAGGYGYDGYGT